MDETGKAAVRNTILNIRRIWDDGGVTSEDDVKSKIIVPLLNALGWDSEAEAKLRLNLPVAQNFADIVCCIRDDWRVVIEAKAPAESILRHENQLAGYAAYLGAEYGVLTNGSAWAYYLTKEKGPFPELRFVTFDLLQDDPDYLSEILASLLSVSAAVGDDAREAAKELRQAKLLGDFAESVLTVLHNPPEAVLDGIGAAVSGATLSVDFGTDSLKMVLQALVLDRRILGHTGVIDACIDDVDGRLPSRLSLQGTVVQVDNWRKVLLTVAEWLTKQGHELPIGPYTSGIQPTVSRTGEESKAYEQLGNVYINTVGTARTMLRRAQWLLQQCGYTPDTLTVECR